MSATTQYVTFSDLYNGLQRRVRVATSITATENQAKHYINVALQDIMLGFDYKLPWAERRGFLRTHAPYSTGTVAISVGSTSLTGTDSLWNTVNSYNENNARVGGKMILAGGTDLYTVSTVTNDTSITLNNKYVGSAALSGEDYIYFEDTYALASDFLRPVDLQFFTDDSTIQLISRADFRRYYPRPNVSGRPQVACLIDDSFSGSTTPVRKVQLYPYPNNTYVLPYTYITSAVAVTSAGVEGTALSGDTDEPAMPLRYRHAIVLHALYNWYRDKRDDARAQDVKGEYVDIMQRIVNDQDIASHVRASIQPRTSMYTSHAYRPYSKRGGKRIDINGAWDRFER